MHPSSSHALQDVRILQIGVGGFGKSHLQAWHQLGLGRHLYVAEMVEERLKECEKYNLTKDHVTTDYRQFVDVVDAVDVVTPSDSHFALCRAALSCGKDVFVEKPMTMTVEEALRLNDLVDRTGKVLQVGYYYRFHPLSQYTKKFLDEQEIGQIRYVSGHFMGFKRARNDVGVTHTDGIHFLDLFNWLLGVYPEEVYAVIRDHFGRGLEDMSIVLLKYPGGVIGKVESGYIQPGKWKDKVVPNAMTSKEVAIVGSKGTIEIDFETETLTVHDVHHELRDGVWTAIMGGSTRPSVGTANTSELISRELASFLNCVRSRQKPSANATGSGVVLARVMQAIYESNKANRPVQLAH